MQREKKKSKRRKRMGPLALALALEPSTSSSSSLLLPTSYRAPSVNSISAASPVPGLSSKPIHQLSSSLHGLRFHSSTPTIRRAASSNIQGTGVVDSGVSGSDDEEDARFDGNLLLDAKLQLKLEHKMKMKLGKNVRLRRKKLFHTHRMRKKVCCPPSKTNKLKNV